MGDMRKKCVIRLNGVGILKRDYRHHLDMMRAPAQLYRIFGEDRRLLYIGIARNARRRIYQHKSTARWAHEIRRHTIEDFDTREAAVDAEARAITWERPAYNKRRPYHPVSPKDYPHPICPALREMIEPPKPATPQKPLQRGDAPREAIDWDDLVDCWLLRGKYARFRRDG